MLSKYIRFAFLNLWKHKGYTFINISGLAIGIACCLLIFMYVHHEVSYDNFLEKSDRIYRIKQRSASPVKEEAGASTPFKVGPTLVAEYPHFIKSYVRFFNMQEDAETFLNREQDLSFRESHFFFVDSTFIRVFDVKLIRGNPEDALSNPSSLIMTSETARKYFGDENPIGKTLSFKGIQDMTVTGIMESWPENSHISIDIVASFSTLDQIYHGQEYDESWFWNPCWTYILLKKGIQAKDLSDQLPLYTDKYYHPHRSRNESITLGLQPIGNIHLYSNLDQEVEPNGSIFQVYLFSSVAILILFIACINFVNLATARASERTREIGMRKVLGADRIQLFRQFLGESFLTSFLAVIVAVLLVWLILPLFNDFLDMQLVFRPFQDLAITFVLFGLFVVVGFLAGGYPALYLSGLDPAVILRGGAIKDGDTSFRKALVIFQFSLSVLLIIGTAVVFIQLRYMQTKDLGFDKEHVIILPTKQNLTAYEFESFKQELLKNPQIKAVAGTQKVLGSDKQTYSKYAPADESEGRQSSSLTLFVTYDFFKTYGIEVMAGRRFSKAFPTDSEKAVMINQAMLKRLKVKSPEEALGKLFYHYNSEDVKEVYSVIGVVKDFNYTSIKKEIDPLVIRLATGEMPIVKHIQYAAVKIEPGTVKTAIRAIEKAWKKVNYIDPFEFSFEDQELAKTYISEAKINTLATVFSGIGIFVACLGLLGLSSYTSSIRTREIGIRKTLGASVFDVVTLLSKEYIKLVVIANILVWPVIYLMASHWLQNFPYHVSLHWNMIVICVLSMILSLVMCLMTVGYQSVKAALINPVDSISRE